MGFLILLDQYSDPLKNHSVLKNRMEITTRYLPKKTDTYIIICIYLPTQSGSQLFR